MASLVAKKKGNQLHYYVVESARVNGKTRITHQPYVGTAEKVAALFKDRTAPLPLSATALDYGLPGALWLAAEQSGVWAVLDSLWPQARSGPSTAHYLLLAALHRICQPGPKTEVADWYQRASCTRCGAFRPNGSPPRLFGTASNTFRPGAMTMSWKRHRPTYWANGKTSRWSA